MKNIFKKAIAAVLALAMCLSFAGCYNENNTWAAKKGDDTMPIGGYIYYLYSAYSEAAGQVGTDTDVLKGTVEDTDASDWIRNKAEEYLRAYYFINDKFDELGLELTEEEIAEADSATEYTWSYYQETLESMGIAKESFHLAYTMYNTKYPKVVQAMYGEGGEMEIPADELKTYYVDNYTSYEYFYVSLSTTDEEGNSTAMSDEEKAEIKEKLEAYIEQINADETTVSQAATDYAYESTGDASSSTYNAPTPGKTEDLSDTFKEPLASIEDNEATLAETTTGYYVVRKLPIADAYDSATAEDTGMQSLLLDMKGEEFNDYVIAQGAAMDDIEMNEGAMKSVSLSLLVNDANRKGTSSVASEVESSEASSESSETSGEVSSEA